MTLKIGIYSFPAGRLALRGRCGKQADKFTCFATGKGTCVVSKGFPIWLATPKRACYSALIAFP